MRRRWELTEKQWALVEPVLREACREGNRGRPWHDTRAVLDKVFGCLARARSGGSCPQNTSLLDLPPPVPAVDPFGQAEAALRLWDGYCMNKAGFIWMKHSWMHSSRAPRKGLRRRSCASRQGTKIVAVASGDSLSLAYHRKRFACRVPACESVLAGSFLDELPVQVTRWEYHIDKHPRLLHLACLHMMLRRL